MADVRLTPIRRGDPRTITITVQDPEGEPVDLSGSTWSSTVRERPNSATGHDLEINPTQAASGVLALTLTGEQSRQFDQQLVGDLEGTLFGTILSFDAVVLSDVTRLEEAPTGGLVDNITLVWGGDSTELSESVLAILLQGGSGGGGSFLLSGDTGPSQTVAPGNTLLVAGGAGIDTAAAATDRVTVSLDSATIASLDGALQPGDGLASLDSSAANKLSGIAPGAQVNVSPDWEAASGPAHILNKPTLGTAAAESASAFDPAGAAATAQAAAVQRANHTGTQAISTITGLQTALDAKAPLASPALTGNPTVPTAAPGTNSTQAASTAFVAAAVAALIDGAPGAIDTLNELAAALGDDPNFATTVTNALAGKQPLDADLTALATAGNSAVLASVTAAFLSADRTKLDGIAAGAEVNVNADWAAGSGDAQILNKPTLGTAAAQNTSAFATSAQGALADTAVQPAALGDLAAQDEVTIAQIDASGTPSSTTYLRGDGSWSTPAGGGGGGAMDTFALAGDTGTPQTIENGQTVSIVGGTGIDTVAGATDQVSVALDSTTQASLASANTALQPGDGLSALDSTSATKLDGIAAGAEVNIQSDWNAPSGDAHILNKPTLGTAAAASADDFDDSGAAAAAQAYAIQRANHTGVQAISTVTGLQTALDAKAPLASPALTGTPTTPTATAGTNSTQIASTAFVAAAIAALIDGAPGAIDTLNELAAALGDDPDFATTVTNALAGKQPLDSDLSAIAALTTTSFGRGLLELADGAALLSAAGAQPSDSDLTAIAALSTTSFGRSFLTQADAVAVLTLLGVTSSVAELNFVDGVTSAVQTQIDGKQATIAAGGLNIDRLDIDGGTDIGAALVDADLIVVDDGAGGTNRKSALSRVWTYISAKITGGASTIVTSDLTASRALIANSSGKVAVSSVTDTQLGYVAGVTSAIQTQIDSKQATIAAGGLNIDRLDIDGATDIGAAIVDADLLIIDDGAGGTNRKTAMSRIWTYISSKITGGATTILTSDLTASRALVSDASGKVAVAAATTLTELGYVNGVTSAIQTQLNARALAARTVSAGAGMTGGGDLSADRTVALSSGSIASLALADSALQGGSGGSGVPTPLRVVAITAADYAALTPKVSTTVYIIVG